MEKKLTYVFTKSLQILRFRCLDFIDFSFKDKGRLCWKFFHDLESKWRIVMIDSKSCVADCLPKSLVRRINFLIKESKRLSIIDIIIVLRHVRSFSV